MRLANDIRRATIPEPPVGRDRRKPRSAERSRAHREASFFETRFLRFWLNRRSRGLRKLSLSSKLFLFDEGHLKVPLFGAVLRGNLLQGLLAVLNRCVLPQAARGSLLLRGTLLRGFFPSRPAGHQTSQEGTGREAPGARSGKPGFASSRAQSACTSGPQKFVARPIWFAYRPAAGSTLAGRPLALAGLPLPAFPFFLFFFLGFGSVPFFADFLT